MDIVIVGAGEIVEIAAENEDLVALDQLLFVIEPT